MVTDPIADLLTRIRNAQARGKESVDINFSRLGGDILNVLKDEGYIYGFSEVDFTNDSKSSSIDSSIPSIKYSPSNRRKKTSKLRRAYRVKLKYFADGMPSISKSIRVSSPGRRVYTRASEIKPVRSGLGITILSTSKGVMTNRNASKFNVGGEVLAEIY